MEKKIVLLVDDEERLLTSTATLLEEHFYLITAMNGRHALDCLEENSVDCIVLDIEMPVMSGLELLWVMRNSGDTTPAIVVTGRSCLHYAEKCANLSVYGYLRKPYEIWELIEKINSLPEMTSMANIRGNKCLQKDVHPKVQEAIEVIHLNLANTIQIRNLSEQIGVSSDHLSTLFKKALGITPLRYINRLRLEQAKEHLKNSSLSIKEIMAVTGFSSNQQFFKQFKRHTGITPKKFRENPQD